MSPFVRNPKDRFCRVVGHIQRVKVQNHLFFIIFQMVLTEGEMDINMIKEQKATILTCQVDT